MTTSAFNSLWLTGYPGKLYSPLLNGAFCFLCTVFRPDGKPEGKLVDQPWVNWKKLQKSLIHTSLISDITLMSFHRKRSQEPDINFIRLAYHYRKTFQR